MTEQSLIATATASVKEGRGETSNLTYQNNHSRSDLVPGHNYQINAEYVQNNQYKYAKNVGTLEMLKCPTITTISGNNNIDVGESLTLNITVKETQNNTSLRRGTVTIYDNDTIVQNNYVITGENTSISFILNVPGTHSIRAVYQDTGVEYNTSNSNTLTVTVNKLSTNLTSNIETISSTINGNTSISGRLSDKNGGISGANILLKDYDGSILSTVSTDSNGNFSTTYELTNVLADHITLEYNGTNRWKEISKTISIELLKLDVSITLEEGVEGYIDDSIEINAEIIDENNNPVTEGTLEWTIEKVEE